MQQKPDNLISSLNYNNDNNMIKNLIFDNEKQTIWANADQISKLFGRKSNTIIEHIKNIFKEGELDGRTYNIIHSAIRGKKLTMAVMDTKFNQLIEVQGYPLLQYDGYLKKSAEQNVKKEYELYKRRMKLENKRLDGKQKAITH